MLKIAFVYLCGYLSKERLLHELSFSRKNNMTNSLLQISSEMILRSTDHIYVKHTEIKHTHAKYYNVAHDD